jgi:excisionase family DNA binding protein
MPPDTAALEPLLTTEDLAGYLKVPVATVYQWKVRGTGPPAIAVGRHRRYRRADVERWLKERGAT